MNIYVASSWRNSHQPGVVHQLRELGCEVYDFRNPPQRSGFGWEALAEDWQDWTVPQFIAHLDHPVAQQGFDSDFTAMQAADALVLVLPCGRSAHLEAGWAVGAGTPTAILILDPMEPELMYRMADTIVHNQDALAAWVTHIQSRLSAAARAPAKENTPCTNP